MSINNFISRIAAELIRSVNNNYTDNYDKYRFGELEIPETSLSIKKGIIKKLNHRGYFNNINNWNFSNKIKSTEYPFSDFFYLYDILEDESSKELLIKIVAYRILGHTKIKLPLNTPAFWANLKMIEENLSTDDFIDLDFLHFKLQLSELNYLGVPIKMYTNALGVNIDFIIKQYEFHSNGINIIAEPGEVIIDAGGCYGDTALYFANLVGSEGRVKVFEFIPKNIILFQKNVQLNAQLEPMIELIDKPLWSESEKDVYFEDNGPASRVALEPFKEQTGVTTTMAIDDYIKIADLDRVDFIKMDIEGAEINALHGAIETIKRFQPKLAIALYHSTSDFDSIPRFINNLNLGYKFYLSHATIYGEETMLFAKTAK